MGRILAIDGNLQDEVSAQAKASPRLRRNLNLHVSEQEPCNRLLNAMEPGTYFVPHRHADASKDETLIMLRGRAGILVFDDSGDVTEKMVMEAGGDACGVNIPHNVYHSIVVLAPGTMVFEAKGGPYRPFQPDELAPWAPREGAPEVPAYLAGMEKMFAQGGLQPQPNCSSGNCRARPAGSTNR